VKYDVKFVALFILRRYDYLGLCTVASMVGCLVNDELEKIWKEDVLA
jgi:hypothetical protein